MTELLVASDVFDQRDEERYYANELATGGGFDDEAVEAILLKPGSLNNDSYVKLRKIVRVNGYADHQRGAAYLALMGHKSGSVEAKMATQKYQIILEKALAKCPGCAANEASHVPTFGNSQLRPPQASARRTSAASRTRVRAPSYVLNADDAWQHEIFRHYPLSQIGIAASKRVLMALGQASPDAWCPSLPHLVCLLCLYLPESDAYLVASEMMDRSRSQSKSKSLSPNQHARKRNASPIDVATKMSRYLNTDPVSSSVLSKVFLDEVKRSMPKSFNKLTSSSKARVDMERLFASTWFDRLFLDLLPPKYVVRILDVMMTEGDEAMIRFGMAILSCFKKEIELLKDPVSQLNKSINSAIELMRLASENAQSSSSSRRKPRTSSGLSSGGSSSATSSFGAGKRRASSVIRTFRSRSRTGSFMTKGGAESEGDLAGYLDSSGKKHGGLTFRKLSKVAYGFKKGLKPDHLAKLDDFHRKIVSADRRVVSAYAKDISRPPHFSSRVMKKSQIFKTATEMSVLVQMLPPKVRLKATTWSLVYSTERDGRSLHSLYACVRAREDIGACILLVTPVQSESKPAAVFGAFSSAPLVPETRAAVSKDAWRGDDSCFVFTLSPEVQKYSSTQSDSSDVATGGAVTPASARFVAPQSKSLMFGAISHLSSVDQSSARFMLYDDDAPSPMIGEASKTIGPSLFLDEDFLQGHSGYSVTYANEPLYSEGLAAPMSADNVDKATLAKMAHSYFDIAMVEVIGLKRI